MIHTSKYINKQKHKNRKLILSVTIITRCPPNFQSVHRTHDQDSDADLWRDNTIFFSKTKRYLCISKSEGLPEYIVETLRIIGEKENPPEGFSLLTRTADTEQKAWRKKQIAYKLAKRGSAKDAVTDIILCARVKNSPEGFQLAGDINGILVCFKTENLQRRAPPAIPSRPVIPNYDNIGSDLNHLNLNQKSPLYPVSHHCFSWFFILNNFCVFSFQI